MSTDVTSSVRTPASECGLIATLQKLTHSMQDCLFQLKASGVAAALTSVELEYDCAQAKFESELSSSRSFLLDEEEPPQVQLGTSDTLRTITIPPNIFSAAIVCLCGSHINDSDGQFDWEAIATAWEEVQNAETAYKQYKKDMSEKRLQKSDIISHAREKTPDYLALGGWGKNHELFPGVGECPITQ